MMESSPSEDVKPNNAVETIKLTFSAPHRGKCNRLKVPVGQFVLIYDFYIGKNLTYFA